MIKCIVSDLDGTLLNKKHNISEVSARTVRRAIDAGYEFIVATGRDWNSVYPVFEPYEIHCTCVLLNGSVVRDQDGKILAKTEIAIANVKEIVRILLAYDVNIQLYTNLGNVTPQPERIRNEFLRHMINAEGLREQDAEKLITDTHFFDFDVVIKDWNAFFEQDVEVYKMEAFSNDNEKMKQIKEDLKKVSGVEVSNSVGDNLEITSIHAQKGLALEALIAKKGYKKEEVVVFGDGMNDYLMMKNFPHSYAPSNARERIKAVAAHVIGHHDDNAVADMIHQLMEKNNEKSKN